MALCQEVPPMKSATLFCVVGALSGCGVGSAIARLAHCAAICAGGGGPHRGTRVGYMLPPLVLY